MESESPNLQNAAEIVASFTSDNLTFDRNSASRAISEAIQVWPGATSQMWPKWLSEACLSVGLSTKIVDCTISEACELARDGAQFITYRMQQAADGDDGVWLAVSPGKRGKYQVLETGTSSVEKPTSLLALKNILDRFDVDGHVRCLIVLSKDASVSSEPGHKMSPLKRLWMLLAPESHDIWVVAVFAFVTSILMLATPIAVETLVNTVAFGRFLQPIFVLSAILLTFLGFQGAIKALQTYVVEIIQQRLFARVAADLSYRLPRADLEAVDGEYMPDLVNRFFDIVTVQKVVATLLLDGLGLVLNTVIGMAVLAFYHPWLLGFDIFLLSAIALIVFGLGRGAVASAVGESKQKYYMAGWLEEVAHCPTAFRGDGGAEFALERSDQLIHQYLMARRKHFRIVFRQIMFALALQAISSTLLLGLGGWLVVTGELTLGQLVAAELIVTVIVGSFAKIGKHLEGFYDLLTSVDKLGSLFDIQMEREDGVLGLEESAPVQITLSSVSYAYPNGPTAIQNVTGEIASGERIPVVGGYARVMT